MRKRLDDPTYLLHLAEREAENVLGELLKMDPTALQEGRRLSVDQYHFLLRQTVDRLRKSNKLPVKPLDGERFQAFERPFWEVLNRAGVL